MEIGQSYNHVDTPDGKYKIVVHDISNGKVDYTFYMRGVPLVRTTKDINSLKGVYIALTRKDLEDLV